MNISYTIGAIVVAILIIGGIAWYDSTTQVMPTTVTGQYSPAGEGGVATTSPSAVSGAATGADQEVNGSSIGAPASSVAPVQILRSPTK